MHLFDSPDVFQSLLVQYSSQSVAAKSKSLRTRGSRKSSSNRVTLIVHRLSNFFADSDGLDDGCVEGCREGCEDGCIEGRENGCLDGRDEG